jgi:hypothetical protein
MLDGSRNMASGGGIGVDLSGDLEKVQPHGKELFVRVHCGSE